MAEDGKAIVEEMLGHADSTSSESEGPTIQEIYDTMNDDQKQVVDYLVGLALQENGQTPS